MAKKGCRILTHHKKKSAANRKAKARRNKGHSARVVRSGKKWAVKAC